MEPRGELMRAQSPSASPNSAARVHHRAPLGLHLAQPRDGAALLVHVHRAGAPREQHVGELGRQLGLAARRFGAVLPVGQRVEPVPLQHFRPDVGHAARRAEPARLVVAQRDLPELDAVRMLAQLRVGDAGGRKILVDVPRDVVRGELVQIAQRAAQLDHDLRVGQRLAHRCRLLTQRHLGIAAVEPLGLGALGIRAGGQHQIGQLRRLAQVRVDHAQVADLLERRRRDRGLRLRDDGVGASILPSCIMRSASGVDSRPWPPNSSG